MLSAETRKLTDEMEQHFFVPFDLQNEKTKLDQLVQPYDSQYAEITNNFIESLAATIHSTSAPFLLANQSVQDQEFQRISIAEQIRALPLEHGAYEPANIKADRQEAARKVANAKMRSFSESSQGVDNFCADTARFLIRMHQKHEVKLLAQELLLQGTVATWSALEMLVRDLLTMLLNRKPNLVLKITANPNTKKKFEIPKLTIEDIAQQGFDLSMKMGTLLFDERDFSNLSTLQSACEALVGKQSLREKLAAPMIWQLNQDRHLIAHHRGVVDEDYLRKTSSQLKVGTQINIAPKEFEDRIKAVAGIGEALVIGLTEIPT